MMSKRHTLQTNMNEENANCFKRNLLLKGPMLCQGVVARSVESRICVLLIACLRDLVQPSGRGLKKLPNFVNFRLRLPF